MLSKGDGDVRQTSRRINGLRRWLVRTAVYAAKVEPDVLVRRWTAIARKLGWRESGVGEVGFKRRKADVGTQGRRRKQQTESVSGSAECLRDVV